MVGWIEASLTLQNLIFFKVNHLTGLQKKTHLVGNRVIQMRKKSNNN